jgi:cell division protein FtsA
MIGSGSFSSGSGYAGCDVAPRPRPLAPRKNTILSVLDIGTSKIACIVAELVPAVSSDILRGRTHMVRVRGIGHCRSMGIKGGTIIDMEAAEQAIRQAVDAAERMARMQIQSVLVSISGGRLGSQHLSASHALARHPVTQNDKAHVLQMAGTHGLAPSRCVLHALPVGYRLDDQSGIPEPIGMVGEKLSVDMHMVSADSAVVRNLMVAIERCHLEVEAVVSTPYAAGLSALVEDEAEMGSLLIDMGGGTTSVGLFHGSYLSHVDAFAVGGQHVTLDIARGLSTRVTSAERLKTLYGSCMPSSSDERETIAVAQVDEGDRDAPSHLPKSHLVRIIRPRLEEILELIRDRLKAVGITEDSGRRIVLTGGASQLAGLPELTRRVLKGNVRIGRPLGLKGLPEAAKGPAFAAACGLLIYPQVAHLEHEDFAHMPFDQATGTNGYFSKLGRWLKESF